MSATQNSVLIRDAGIADVPAITRIYAPCVLSGIASFEEDPPTEQEMLRRMTVLMDGGYPYVVAAVDGTVAGYACAGPYRSRPGYRSSVESSIYVAEASQGKGIGKQLLRRIVAMSVEAGYRQMVAIIGTTGCSASVALHRAAGFQKVGTLSSIGYKSGQWVDTVIMQRSLGDGDSTPPP